MHHHNGFWIILIASASMPGWGICQEEGHSKVDSLFTGTWRGTSICQLKNSPCHDENVVFYISPVSDKDVIEVTADKIVNGTEVAMGKILFRFDVASAQIISIDRPNAVWKFARVKEALQGTLHYNNELFRVIDLKRKN